MTLIIKRWKQKPVYVDVVEVTLENYLEVGTLLDAHTAILTQGLEVKRETVTYERANQANIRVNIGEKLVIRPDGYVVNYDEDELKASYKRV